LINTDAIDNSAGVDCSDHEVNIKILLSGLESAGELSRAERDALLAEMADDVTGLVLRDNYQQALALARNAAIAAEYGQVHLRYIQSLESNGHINRPLESLPTDKQFAERLIARQGLCRPELAVILAHTKMVGYDDLVASTVPDDPYFEARLDEYFPPKLRARFAGAISGHPLRREIIATSIINELVNRQEVSFLFRLQDETEASIPDIVCAYIASVDLLDARSCWAALDGLDGTLAEPERFVLLRRQNNHIEAATRWLLRHPTRSPEPGSMVERFRAPLNAIFATLPDVLADSDRERYADDTRQMTTAGVPEAVACRLALCDLVSAPLDIADITFASGESLGSAISLYFDVRSALQLDWLQKRVLELPDSTLMELLARISLRDGLDRLHREIAKAVLAEPGGANGDSRVQRWLTRNATALKRSSRLVSEMRDRNTADAAAIGLVLTEMRELV
jgi:glutamate dehydrogenase